jgi:CRISPR/Cas system-associated endoribonuclease Cas2
VYHAELDSFLQQVLINVQSALLKMHHKLKKVMILVDADISIRIYSITNNYIIEAGLVGYGTHYGLILDPFFNT